MGARFGAFGKMPSLGDFLRMDLAQGFIDPWDRWLQEGMLAARTALGEGWQDCYFSAPIWRFTLSPGLAGAAAIQGVMMMSVDRVGRQFPMTLASPLADGQAPVLAHLQAAAMFAALETLALDALEDGMTRDILQTRLAGVAMPPSAEMPVLMQAQGGVVVLAENGDLTSALAARQVAGTFRKPSVWTADLGGQARMMVCEGLPAGGQVNGLFDMAAHVWREMEDA
ncbi:MAG: type VI secretion system-associated protein TagF [Gemmobacter sp.]